MQDSNAAGKYRFATVWFPTVGSFTCAGPTDGAVFITDVRSTIFKFCVTFSNMLLSNTVHRQTLLSNGREFRGFEHKNRITAQTSLRDQVSNVLQEKQNYLGLRPSGMEVVSFHKNFRRFEGTQCIHLQR